MTYLDFDLPEPSPLDRLISQFLFGLAAMDCGAHGEDCLRTRVGRIKARHLALYLAHVGFNITQKRVAVMFGINPASVSYACRLVETKRDDARFDGRLTALEAALRQTPLPNLGDGDA